MKTLWTQRTPGEKRLLGICVIVIVVALWLVLNPADKGAVKLLSSAEAAKRTTEAFARADQMRTDEARLEPEIAKLAFDKPTAQLVPTVVKTLQGMAKQSDIHLREIKPLRPRRYGELTRIPISVRFSTAAFGQSAVGFLYRVEEPGTRMVVDKFTITSPDPKSRIVDVEVQVALYTRGSSVGDGGA